MNEPIKVTSPMSDEEYNRYLLNKKEKATPYYLSYLAAYNQRPFYEDPIIPVFVDKRPQPKRLFFVIMITILSLALLLVMALSFVKVAPQYLNLFTKVDITDETQNKQVGVDDIIYSTLKKFGLIETEVAEGETPKEYLFYDGCLKTIDEADTTHLIAYYAIPVSIALTAVVALYMFIKGIVGIFTKKRRKFSYMALILLLFSLLGVVGGIVWNGQPLSSILDFITMSGTNIILGIGYIIMIALELCIWICSMCAYRSKKKAKF